MLEKWKEVQLCLSGIFSKEKSDGEKVTYSNPIAIKENGGWRYNYGNMFYVMLVKQYLTTTKFDDKTVQGIFDEAFKYEGTAYVFGGSSPATGFDCSGLTQWCYAKVGLQLPRVAQDQYDAMSHIELKDAKPGDLIFFHSTYDAGTYVTHVGIYAGDNRMFHAGDPVGWTNLTETYWQQHIIGAGRYKIEKGQMMKIKIERNKKKISGKKKNKLFQWGSIEKWCLSFGYYLVVYPLESTKISPLLINIQLMRKWL